MTATEAFTATALRIVKTTGCTPEAAVKYLMDKMIAERPSLAAKVAADALAAR